MEARGGGRELHRLPEGGASKLAAECGNSLSEAQARLFEAACWLLSVLFDAPAHTRDEAADFNAEPAAL